MTDLFGTTRSVVKGRYALLTPEGFVPGFLPGWDKAQCVVLASPALGAGFSQLLITLGRDGLGQGNTGTKEFFVYVVEGSGGITLDDKKRRVEPGSFAYIPAGKDVLFQGSSENLKLLIFQRRYQSLASLPAPAALFGHEREVRAQPLAGNSEARLQSLLPNTPDFDLAASILTFPPGAALPAVETHVAEQGLLVLKGQGVCRLDADFHPVRAGDAIWTGAYCPRWFVAMGKTPASYIYCQDVNRNPP